MKKVISVSALIVCSFIVCIGLVHAQDSYRTEISGSYVISDHKDDSDTTLYRADASIFFTPVKTSGHPLNEAAFIERTGHVVFSGGYGEGEGSSFESDGPLYGISITLREPHSPYSVRAGYHKTDVDFDIRGSANQEHNVNSFSLDIGYFFRPSFIGELQYNYSEKDMSFSGQLPKVTIKDDYYGASVKFLNKLDSDRAYNVEGQAGILESESGGKTDSNIVAAISFDYYFNSQLGAGAGYALNTGDDDSDEGNTFNLNLNYFINSTISVTAAYETFIAKNTEGKDVEALMLGISYRL